MKKDKIVTWFFGVGIAFMMLGLLVQPIYMIINNIQITAGIFMLIIWIWVAVFIVSMFRYVNRVLK